MLNENKSSPQAVGVFPMPGNPAGRCAVGKDCVPAGHEPGNKVFRQNALHSESLWRNFDGNQADTPGNGVRTTRVASLATPRHDLTRCETSASRRRHAGRAQHCRFAGFGI